jgi:hypothetical protein
MTYGTYFCYVDRLGKDTGFEDKLTTYCFRRGTANAIDSMYLIYIISFSQLMVLLGVAPDAVRDQVMKHDSFTGVFNGTYINHTVRFNVQNTFLESNISNDGLTRAFTHISIRCNLGALKEVLNEVIERLCKKDSDIIEFG